MVFIILRSAQDDNFIFQSLFWYAILLPPMSALFLYQKIRERALKTLFLFIFSAFFILQPAEAKVDLPFRDTSFSGKYVSQSVPDPIALKAGEVKEVVVKIKNTGSSTWLASGKNYVSAYTVDPSYHASLFAGAKWLAKDHPTIITKATKPGETAELKIMLYAPEKPGSYEEHFNLAAENKTWIKGTHFFLKIKVTEPEAEVATAQPSETEEVVSTTTEMLEEVAIASSTVATNTENRIILDREPILEPTIRVGIYKTSAPVTFQTDFDYEVWMGEESFGYLPRAELVTLSYSQGVYGFVSPSITFEGAKPIRLAPFQPDAYFVLPNVERRISGRKPNYNAYRGALEYRYSPLSKMPYLVNELSLERYVAGVTETSDSAPPEYIKALQIAARTYAFVRISGLPPTDRRLFDVFATTQDQLYLGYNSEKDMPKVEALTKETSGLMVTYKRNPVTTNYFSRSNGKTKTRAGSPWLTSVVAKYDVGLTQHGHGYGMSGRDAMLRAQRDGWTFDQILTYYYSGTQIEKMY